MGKHINRPPKGPDDGKTGYRKPPKEHQWPKGKSGNPNGRPPGSKGVRTDLKKVLSETRARELGGEWTTGTVQFLMLHSMGRRALMGDVKAFVALLPLILEAFGLEDRDFDQNRLSADDEALFARLLGRRDEDTPKPKSKRRRRKAASTAEVGGGTSARKPRSGNGNKVGGKAPDEDSVGDA